MRKGHIGDLTESLFSFLRLGDGYPGVCYISLCTFFLSVYFIEDASKSNACLFQQIKSAKSKNPFPYLPEVLAFWTVHVFFFKNKIKIMCYIPVTGCSLPVLFHVLHRLSCISLWSAPYLFSQVLLNGCLLVDCSPLHCKYAVTSTILYLHLCTFAFLSDVSIRINAAWLRIKVYHGNVLLWGSAPVSM